MENLRRLVSKRTRNFNLLIALDIQILEGARFEKEVKTLFNLTSILESNQAIKTMKLLLSK